MGTYSRGVIASVLELAETPETAEIAEMLEGLLRAVLAWLAKRRNEGGGSSSGFSSVRPSSGSNAGG